MRSLEVAVDFVTNDPKQVPRLGQRKRLRVNGRYETLWANKVDVERFYDHKRSMASRTERNFYHFVGTITYGPYALDGPDPVRD